MIVTLHESKEALAQRLHSVKEKLKTERIYYKAIGRDVSVLLLEIELSLRKLKSVIELLTAEDFVESIVIGDKHVAFFASKIHSRNLLIGIAVRSNPVPLYIFLKISCDPLHFPYRP